MKNFNKRSARGRHGSKRRELAHATRTLTWIARIHSHTYINVVRSASLAITEFGIEFYLKLPDIFEQINEAFL